MFRPVRPNELATKITTGLLFLTLSSMLIISVPAAPAFAQRQSGLVNVAVGDVTVTVPVAIAANIAANVCGVSVPVAVLATQVVAGGGTFTCGTAPQSVTITQQQ